MMCRVLAAVVLLCVSTIALAQSPATSIQGAWKVVEVVTTGTNASTDSSPQPGLYLFTKTHYSIVQVTGSSVRKGNPPLADQSKVTDAEKLTRYEEWNAFAANSGTYEIKGTTLVTHPVVAKNVGVMTAAATPMEFKLEANTLTVIRKGGQFGPSGEVRTKLARVE